MVILLWSVPEVVLCTLEATSNQIHFSPPPQEVIPDSSRRVITLLSFFIIEYAFIGLIYLFVLKSRQSIISSMEEHSNNGQNKRFKYLVLGNMVSCAIACLMTPSSLILYVCGKVGFTTSLLVCEITSNISSLY